MNEHLPNLIAADRKKEYEGTKARRHEGTKGAMHAVFFVIFVTFVTFVNSGDATK